MLKLLKTAPLVTLTGIWQLTSPWLNRVQHLKIIWLISEIIMANVVKEKHNTIEKHLLVVLTWSSKLIYRFRKFSMFSYPLSFLPLTLPPPSDKDQIQGQYKHQTTPQTPPLHSFGLLDSISLYSPDWPWTHYVNQVGLELAPTLLPSFPGDWYIIGVHHHAQCQQHIEQRN